MTLEKFLSTRRSVGIIGFGAFGRLIAKHVGHYFDVYACDVSNIDLPVATKLGVTAASLENVAQCDVIILATPVSICADVSALVAQHCRPDAMVIDVGSVKVEPAQAMEANLPEHVNIVATHPLFGPESARDGIAGLKIAICPIRGRGHRLMSVFLRRKLGLQAIETSPEEHDREAATVQGLTHLIAKVLADMGPMPTRMTTRSFDLLIEAFSMVQNDAPEVFDAIEMANPYAADVRRRFFRRAATLREELEENDN